MRTLLSALCLLTLSLSPACKLSLPIPQGEIDDIARELCAMGHPTATYERARVSDFTTGGMLSSTEHPTVELEIDYEPMIGKELRTMTVRVTVESTRPCSLSTDVLSDTGKIPPVLLDNQLASSAAGESICESFAD